MGVAGFQLKRVAYSVLTVCIFATVIFSKQSIGLLVSGPETPGTIEGSFSVSGSGAAIYTIPIKIPAGTNGMQPSIALTYNSQGGNGLVGMGWSISGLSVIHRCGATKALDGIKTGVYYDDRDKFCLDGQRLLQVGTTNEYRTQRESWKRVFASGPLDNPVSFDVISSNGSVQQYGATADSQIEAIAFDGTNYTPLTLDLGGTRLKPIRVWALNRVEDVHGNYYSISYTENGKGGYQPSRIEYTHDSAGTPYNFIDFGYDPNPRNDVLQRFQAGGVIETTELLVSVSSSTRAGIFRSYNLDYQYDGIDGRTRLKNVQECDRNNTCLPVTGFDWTQHSTDVSKSARFSDTSFPAVPYAFNRAGSEGKDLGTRLVDLNNDGLPDIVHRHGGNKGGAPGAYLNNGQGWDFASGYTPPHRLNGNGIKLIDLNGDGLVDFMYSRLVWVNKPFTWTHKSEAYLNTGQGWVSAPEYKLPATNPIVNMNGKDLGTRFIDLNGDGRVDVITGNGGSKSAYLNKVHEGGGWEYAEEFNPPIRLVGDNGKDLGRRIIDINGDGRMDIVRGGINESVLYGANEKFQAGNYFQGVKGVAYLNTPNGWQSSPQHAPPHYFTSSGADRGTRLTDFNGDGLPDLIHRRAVSSDIPTAYINTGNGWVYAPGFKPPFKIASEQGKDRGVRLVDVNGDGRKDFVYYLWRSTDWYGAYLSTPGGWVSAPEYIPPFPISDEWKGQNQGTRFSDINGDGVIDIVRGVQIKFPYLDMVTYLDTRLNSSNLDRLNRITNGLGVMTEIDYTALTDKAAAVYVKDDGIPVQGEPDYPLGGVNSYPYIDLQIPQYVVAKFRTSDGQITSGGRQTLVETRYRYGGFKFHVLGGTSLGFRWQEVTDPMGLVSTTYTNQFFEEGANGLTDLSRSVLNGQVIRETSNIWTPISRTGEGPTRAVLTNNTDRAWEPNSGSNSLVKNVITTSSLNDLDAYDNPRKVIVTYGDGLTETTVNNYIYSNAEAYTPAVQWMYATGKLASASVTRTNTSGDTQTKRSSFSYFGTGLVKSETVEPNTSLAVLTEYTYDSFGNQISKTVKGKDINGADLVRSGSQTYDALGRFVTSKTNAAGHTSEITGYDPVCGLPTEELGANGLTRSSVYDGFCRIQQQTNHKNIVSTITYDSWRDGYSVRTETSPVASAPITVFYDRLGRERRTATNSFGNRLTYQDTDFDAWGRRTHVSHPYFAGIETRHFVETRYDLLDRPIEVIKPGVSQSDIIKYESTMATLGIAGTRVTTTNSLFQSRSVIKNEHGDIIEATDNGGQLLYAYNFDQTGNTVTVTKITDSLIMNIVTHSDLLGRKTRMSDPDMGNWSYQYNAFGELRKQTDAKNQTTESQYDVLGRMIQRKTAEGTQCDWVYDQAARGSGVWNGLLDRVVCNNGYQKWFEYNDIGQVITTNTDIDGSTYTVRNTYDPQFYRPEDTIYPGANLTVRNVYDQYGNLTEVLDVDNNNAPLWKIETDATKQGVDAHGRVVNVRLGNNVASDYDFGQPHERKYLRGITTYKPDGTKLQDLAYEFDDLGNLTRRVDGALRKDGSPGIDESFTYDTLNRLTSVTGPAPKTFVYDAAGRIVSKTGVGDYHYDQTNGAGPHALTAITPDTADGLTASYQYDAIGNLTRSVVNGKTRDLSYTGFNKPSMVATVEGVTNFTYGASQQRIQKDSATGSTTTYIGGLYEYVEYRGSRVHKFYVYAGRARIAVRTINKRTVSTQYLHTGHIESIELITNEQGNVAQRLEYDAWGKRRNLDGTDLAEGEIPAGANNITTRGFTGQEHDDDIGFINMNARLYDPTTGRFITADTLIQFPTNTQSYNRYSYLLNNPTSYTDPTGHSLSSVFKGKSAQKVAMVVSVIITVWFPPASAAMAFWQSFFISFVASGGDLESAFIGGFQGMASYGIAKGGTITSPATRIIAHGVSGGVFTQMRGGRFREGFAAGFVGGMSGQATSGMGSPAARVLIAGMFGGAASKAAGGEFESGFLTAAFVQMAMEGTAREKPINEVRNDDGYPVRNPFVQDNLEDLANGFASRGIKLDLDVTGGESYVDSKGIVRSSKDGSIIKDSAGNMRNKTSPHNVKRGSRAVDVRKLKGVSKSTINGVAKNYTDFKVYYGPGNGYADGHIHLYLRDRIYDCPGGVC